MSVIVACRHPVAEGIMEDVAAEFPAVFIERISRDHIADRTDRWTHDVVDMPFVTVDPVRTVRIYPFAVDIVKLACLKEIWGGDFFYFTINAEKVLAESDNSGAAGKQCCGG